MPTRRSVLVMALAIGPLVALSGCAGKRQGSQAGSASSDGATYQVATAPAAAQGGPIRLLGGQPEWVSIFPWDMGPDHRRTVTVVFDSQTTQGTVYIIKYYVTPNGGAEGEDNGIVFQHVAAQNGKVEPISPRSITVGPGERGFAFTIKTHSNLQQDYTARIEVINSSTNFKSSDTIVIDKDNV